MTDPQASSAPSQLSSDDRIAELEAELASLQKQAARLERIEQAHAWQTAFLQQLVDLIPLGIAVHTDGVATYINATGAHLLGAKGSDEILGKPALSFVHPDFRDRAVSRIRELQEAVKDVVVPVAPYVEEKFVRVDGSVIDVEVAAVPLHMPRTGHSLMVLFRDITDEKRQQRLLQEREIRFRQLVSLLPVATIIHKNGTILFANQTTLDLLRLNSEDDIVGCKVLQFVHPDEHDLITQRIRQVTQTQQPLPLIKERIVRADGDVFLAETSAFPFIEQGEPATLVVLRDVTQQEQMLKALEKSEAKFRTLAELLPASVFIVNQQGKLLFINRASQNILGFTAEESLQMDFKKLIHPDSQQIGPQKVGAAGIGESIHFEMQIKNKLGQWRWLDVHLIKTIIDDELVGLGVATDITWRKQTEMLLKQQAQKLVRAYEDERARIARELHDEIGQQLIGMKFVLERARHFVSSEEGSSALDDASQILSNLTEMVRELSLSFRPAQLDDLGLLPTLVWHFDRYTNRTGIQVHFSHLGLDGRTIPRTAAITVYRVVQESLTNVARHAQADSVNVSIHVDHATIYLTITDNGIGFDSSQALAANVSSGLRGMQERVQLLGGELTFESAEGQGVSIFATIPLCSDSETTSDSTLTPSR